MCAGAFREEAYPTKSSAVRLLCSKPGTNLLAMYTLLWAEVLETSSLWHRGSGNS